MGYFVTFLAGFAGGWLTRSGFDSSRSAAVRGVSVLFQAADRMKRVVAMEREHLEDLVAEARAHYEAKRTASRVEAVPPSNDSVRKNRAA